MNGAGTKIAEIIQTSSTLNDDMLKVDEKFLAEKVLAEAVRVILANLR
jgi:hypothetical protein